jgi:hypothetical protein
VDIIEFCEIKIGIFPSPVQKEILYKLAGRDPYEWDTEYQQYIIAVGQGGGKNKYIIAPFTAYTAYKIANMKDPWMYFSRFTNEKIDRSTKFEITNSSLVNADQAETVHFDNMKSLLRRVKDPDGQNWFEKYAGMNMNDSFGDIKTGTISIPTHIGCGDIIMYSFDSTPTAPEGKSIILGIVDEPSRAETKATFKKAKQLWNVISGNLNTRFGRNVGKQIALSYLNNSEYDLTYHLLQQAEEEDKLFKGTANKSIMYAVNYSTFDVNPNASKTDPAVAKMYRNDLSDAQARYEGVKGTAKEGFFQPYPQKIRECYFDIESPVKYKYGVTARQVTNPRTEQVQINKFVKIDFESIKGDNKIRGWAYDPAEKYDGFVLKGGYIETMDEMKDELFIGNREELIVINQRPIIDITIIWQPQNGLTVDFENVGEVLGILIKKFPNSRFAYSDKWNSISFSQQFQSKGIFSETFGFGNAQQLKYYSKVRWMMFNNIPQFAKNNMLLKKNGVEKTIGDWEISEFERLLKENNRVDHPVGGSKDLSDSNVILINGLIELQGAGTVMSGASSLTDVKITALVDRFMVERQKLRNLKVNPSLFLKLIAAELEMNMKDIQTLADHVNQYFPNT